jgi:hypothetical protein
MGNDRLRSRQDSVGIVASPVKKLSTHLPFPFARRCAVRVRQEAGPTATEVSAIAVLDLVFLLLTLALFGALALITRGVGRL